MGLLCSLPSAAQEIAPASSASPDIASKVTLTPSPFAQLVKDPKEKTNLQQTTSPQQQVQQQAQQAQGQQQQKPDQQPSGTSHDRLFWALPNFLTVENADNVPPLTPGQKFKVVARGVFDPTEFVLVGFVAGLGQASDSDPSYGQGAQGYAKRYGASYADLAIGTFIGSAILPSILKQDPRYFYKGSGSTRSRSEYAIANAVICKGDNGRWQVNYSNILGSLAAGAISNLYYPSQNRNGPALTFENTAVGIGATAVANLIEEFLMRKLTPNLPKHDRATP